MIRPHIPVRDGLRFPKRGFRPAWMPEVGQVEYRAGFLRGWVCGVAAGGLICGIIWGMSTPSVSPYTPVYEQGTNLLIGWCGGPAPTSIPQQRADVDITWAPTCQR